MVHPHISSHISSSSSFRVKRPSYSYRWTYISYDDTQGNSRLPKRCAPLRTNLNEFYARAPQMTSDNVDKTIKVQASQIAKRPKN